MAFSFPFLVAILALISLIFHASYVYGRLGIKDIPNERSLHTEITKKSGGMVFIPLFLAFVLVWVYQNPSYFPESSAPKLLILGSLFFCILGFIDDLFHLSPNLRLFLEFAFSFLWVYFLNPTVALFGHPLTHFFPIILISGFLIVFIVNLVNFMDGLDLYLVGTLFVSTLFWIPFYPTSFLPNQGYFFVLSLLLSAISGFAFFNFPKAKLFMGDSGSLAIGFILVSLPILASKDQGGTFELLNLFFLFPIFWIDGILTIAIRAFQKKHIFSAHREHFYQKLTETKLGKPGACFLMVFANLPANILYSLYVLKVILIPLRKEFLISLIILSYIIFYSLLRFVFFRDRKNLA